MKTLDEQLEYLIELAISDHVNDIHIQCNDPVMTVAFRGLQGLKEVKCLDLTPAFIEFCKFKANCDSSIYSIPQTGRFELLINKQLILIRFSIIETYHAKSVALRILNGVAISHFNRLTNNQKAIKKLQTLSAITSGLILFSGSTGSGKTTTMLTFLKNLQQKRIYTLEDPIEQLHQQFMQLQINEKRGLTYSNGLAHLLRHDPDVIVLGEIRNAQEAKVAISAAYTGHLVCCSIHASSAYLTLGRLMDLGVSTYDLMHVCQAIIYQTLTTNVQKKSRSAQYDILDQKEISTLLLSA